MAAPSERGLPMAKPCRRCGVGIGTDATWAVVADEIDTDADGRLRRSGPPLGVERAAPVRDRSRCNRPDSTGGTAPTAHGRRDARFRSSLAGRLRRCAQNQARRKASACAKRPDAALPT
jgi:hypothetical protein